MYKVNWLTNILHLTILIGSLPAIQQVYAKNMGAADHVNQGNLHYFFNKILALQLYPFKHRSIKWTNVPFYAMISLALWNATVTIRTKDNSHELYKKVLVEFAHKLGDPFKKYFKNIRFNIKRFSFPPL